jgi:hypothetical protein
MKVIKTENPTFIDRPKFERSDVNVGRLKEAVKYLKKKLMLFPIPGIEPGPPG